MRVYFKTFGCRTNLFDTQVMMSALREGVIVEDEAYADVVVVNSCTVTNSADVSVRSYINAMAKQGKKVYLTGCGAYTKGEELLRTQRVQGVFGASEKYRLEALLQRSDPFYELGDLNHIDTTIVDTFAGKSRAFIKIQEGCNFRCSYCIIPYVRGDARSMDEALILEQVRVLAEHGFGEFVLTGTNVGSYAQGRGDNIAQLMMKMSQIRGVRRIRVGSLEPIQINDPFKEILDEPWLERHLHIAIQHTHPKMLRLMNRRNRYESDRELFEMLHERGFALGSDFIVGHPGEDEVIWREAMENIAALHLTHLHPFTYSPREGTPSAMMRPIVAGDIAQRRLHELKGWIAHNNRTFRHAHAHKPLEVLWESYHEGVVRGYDQYFNPIYWHSEEDHSGEWMTLTQYEVGDEANYA